jgi:hypothetical protein
MRDEVLNLMRLVHSMVMVSFPIEVLRQPGVPHSAAALLESIGDPIP